MGIIIEAIQKKKKRIFISEENHYDLIKWGSSCGFNESQWVVPGETMVKESLFQPECSFP